MHLSALNGHLCYIAHNLSELGVESEGILPEDMKSKSISGASCCLIGANLCALRRYAVGRTKCTPNARVALKNENYVKILSAKVLLR